MNDVFERKGVLVNEHSVKDIDQKKGIVTGYFSIFGNKDSDDDVIVPGAFTRTLKENYRRVKHLYQHDPWRPLSGVAQDRLLVKEDKYGLYFESTISQTSWGQDAVRLYADGVIDEQSIGFQTVKSNDKNGYRELVELKLWEGSAVTWGANEMARTSSMKSMFTKETVCKKLDTVIKALRNGKYEHEEIFDQLELYFKQLQQFLIEITAAPAPVDSTSEDESKTLNTIFSLLKV